MLLGFMGFHDSAFSDENIINEPLMSSETLSAPARQIKLREGLTDDHGY